ncbi:MAG: sporulation transcriptional regulator SpoIIID [Clostridia bacterium]|nr:sporulation transcriptional regulator SpoIIID [Clostridia bacterium]
MTDTVEDRARELGLYIVEHRATVRAVAKQFGVSKSSVHKDVTSRLYWIDRSLFEQVRAVLEENKRERHLRGGAATREKYRKLQGK